MTVTVHHGDSRDVLKTIPDATFDSVVCDPPYALVSIGKRFGSENAAAAKPGKTGAYARASAGFMGKKWDTGETAFDPAFWVEVMRTMKPGAHLIAFSGTRTYHRLACAIEDAGLEMRDMIAWLYGSGFPKSHNVKEDGWEGWGTALKPAIEPIVLARKPLIGTVAANVLTYGTGALNVDASRIDGSKTPAPIGEFRGSAIGATGLRGVRDGSQDTKGRWPANVIHDGSEEVLSAFPQTAPGEFLPHHKASGKGQIGTFDIRDRTGETHPTYGDSGSAARFFYSSKADAADRCGSKHPTVKPTDLMAYLCRLVTRPGGLILDPFAGSGSTGMACLREGFDCVLIEREAEYVADIHRRLAHVEGADTPLFSAPAEPDMFGAAA